MAGHSILRAVESAIPNFTIPVSVWRRYVSSEPTSDFRLSASAENLTVTDLFFAITRRYCEPRAGDTSNVRNIQTPEAFSKVTTRDSGTSSASSNSQTEYARAGLVGGVVFPIPTVPSKDGARDVCYGPRLIAYWRHVSRSRAPCPNAQVGQHVSCATVTRR